MNIFKNKRFIATTLTFVMVMTLAGLPLPAKERRGAKVSIWRGDGSVIEGELIQVKGRTLRLATAFYPVLTIDIADIKKIKITKKANLLKASTGPIILEALFITLGLLVSHLDEGTSWLENPGFLFQAACTSISAGGVISALSKLERTYELEGKPQTEIDRLLGKLDELAHFPGDLPILTGAGLPPVIFAAPQFKRIHFSAAMGFNVMSFDKGYENALAGAESANPKIFAAKRPDVDPQYSLHLAYFRAEYSLNRKLRVGLQFTLPHDRLEYGYIAYDTWLYRETFCYTEERHKSRLFFLIASYAPETDTVYKRSGIRLGAGIGLGDITTISRITYDDSWKEYDKFRHLVPALTTFAGYDYYINPNISIGVNLDYRLVLVQVPAYEFRCYYNPPDYLNLPAIIPLSITIPVHRVNVGELAYSISFVCRL